MTADYGKVTMSKVADGIYLFTTSPYGDVGFGGNAVAILTGEGVVMFDTGGTLAADEDFLRQKRSVTYTFPNTTFAGSATLYAGGREIRVMHARAITPGDTYVFLPKEKVLITGDILVHPIPFAVGGSYPQEWIQTLQELDGLNVQTIVPGHGEAESDKSYLGRNLKLFRHVLADVTEAKGKGLSAEQTKSELVGRTAAYGADLGIAESQLARFKGYFLEVFIDRAYRELERPLGDDPK
jgi:glyoxylase-like metal-dependent hydrolase (beta-lactamase superfamily II)